MNDKTVPTRQILSSKDESVRRLGIFVNDVSGLLFHAYDLSNTAKNRIKINAVWLDEDGFICVDVEKPYIFVNRSKQIKPTRITKQ